MKTWATMIWPSPIIQKRSRSIPIPSKPISGEANPIIARAGQTAPSPIYKSNQAPVRQVR